MESEKKYCYVYPRPAVTTDCVVFGLSGKEVNLLLVERKNEPYKGYWAIPGGFLNIDEDAKSGAQRELAEETGLNHIPLVQFHTFSAVNRDPRHRTISIAYYAIVKLEEHIVRAGDDAAQARWFPLHHLPPLAFDHTDIVQMAIRTAFPKSQVK